ncbi:hypothetical protein [Heyndrickxia camelliae]|uniref:Uncharacterized protein n=1 Tax=Heyndrickxia camelliae TaxID=1707093 RepID=A0A2N3LF23_9BACI|nr:hypothetical protein [Heyndrickxia camelliae]PKR83242.1 hypothetical protein CWO92_19760 [Heyndrickxia camelliae]
MLQHAMTIRKWIDELNELAWSNVPDIEHKHEEYIANMSTLFQQLQQEYGMTKQMFSALTEQALTL